MLTLQMYFRSSASYRVRIALELKSLACRSVPVHLVRGGGEQHSASFAALNPAQLVPVLDHDGFTLTQSLAIIEYLDEIHPVPSLLPGDAASRARIRAIAQQIACEIQSRAFRGPQPRHGPRHHAQDRGDPCAVEPTRSCRSELRRLRARARHRDAWAESIDRTVARSYDRVTRYTPVHFCAPSSATRFPDGNCPRTFLRPKAKHGRHLIRSTRELACHRPEQSLLRMCYALPLMTSATTDVIAIKRPLPKGRLWPTA